MRLSMFLACVVTASLVGASEIWAQETRIRTDANIVTALDVSDSIGRYEQWIERDGLARAITHPAFLDAVASGRWASVGFAVFTWSSEGRSQILIPWTVIKNAEDAKLISRHLLSVSLIDESQFSGGDREELHVVRTDDRLTDVSEAIDLASHHLASAPFVGARSVMNIVGNGMDNVAAGPLQARNRAMHRGFTINGLVVGRDLPSVVEHYRTEVIGGPGAFLLEVADPEHVRKAFVAKLDRKSVV